MPEKTRDLKKEIVAIGRELYALRLVSGCAGNLSARLAGDNILITATRTCLGALKYGEIIQASLNKESAARIKRASNEFPLHRLIYKNFPAKVVIHCHPPLTNAYFSVYPRLKNLTFESEFYLERVPLVEQKGLTMTQPELVIRALRAGNLVVVKNHGVVCLGSDFKEALYLIEVLEESVKIAAVARLFNKKVCDKLDKALKRCLNPGK
jgi:L-fuculose-phosphate aldolase